MDFSSLDVLNDAAVAEATLGFHDSIAREASGGAGGVYRSTRADLRPHEARIATWIQKPAGEPYRSFYEEIARCTGKRRVGVWQRQMALGPAPEFCIHSEVALQIPARLRPVTTAVEPVADPNLVRSDC